MLDLAILSPGSDTPKVSPQPFSFSTRLAEYQSSTVHVGSDNQFAGPYSMEKIMRISAEILDHTVLMMGFFEADTEFLH